MKSLITFTALAGCVLFAGCASQPQHTLTTANQKTEHCKKVSEAEISALFDRWNESLASGNPSKVVANYAERSILLPTVSNKVRFRVDDKEDYFAHFLENHQSGKIDQRFVDIGCNTAMDAGLYTFSFAKTGTSVSGRYSYTYHWDGEQWLITSHHSSVMPETL